MELQLTITNLDPKALEILKELEMEVMRVTSVVINISDKMEIDASICNHYLLLQLLSSIGSSYATYEVFKTIKR